jgi:hypothetical protein
MPAPYPYNDRKETDDATDKSPYLHRCDYSECRAPATQFFKSGPRLCGHHGDEYTRKFQTLSR